MTDGKEDVAKDLQVGSYYAIQKLNLKKSTVSGQVQGRLGGSERLIQLLRAQGSVQEELKQAMLEYVPRFCFSLDIAHNIPC